MHQTQPVLHTAINRNTLQSDQLRECVVMQMVQNKGSIAPTILNFKRRLTPITNAGLNLYLKISMVGADSPNLQYVKQARYDIEYLTCSKKLMCSQLSLPRGTNRKITEKKQTKNKPSPVPRMQICNWFDSEHN